MKWFNVSTKHFSVHNKHFIAEISVLSYVTKHLVSKIFPDVISLVSEKTGKVSHWEKDSENVYGGEVNSVSYVPTEWTIQEIPILKDWEVTILND